MKPKRLPSIYDGVSEKQWQASVRDKAEKHRWVILNASWLSLHSPTGFPDLTLAKEQPDGSWRLLFVELKREKGSLTLRQEISLDILGRVPGVLVKVWRPSDTPEVERILAEGL